MFQFISPADLSDALNPNDPNHAAAQAKIQADVALVGPFVSAISPTVATVYNVVVQVAHIVESLNKVTPKG